MYEIITEHGAVDVTVWWLRSWGGRLECAFPVRSRREGSRGIERLDRYCARDGCAQMGLRFTAVMTESVSSERILMIRAYGGAARPTPAIPLHQSIPLCGKAPLTSRWRVQRACRVHLKRRTPPSSTSARPARRDLAYSNSRHRPVELASAPAAITLSSYVVHAVPANSTEGVCLLVCFRESSVVQRY